MRVVLFIACLLSCLSARAQSLAFDSTNSPGTAHFIRAGTNTIAAGTNLVFPITTLPPGLHSVSVVASNSSGMATSAPITLRLVRLTFQEAGKVDGPFTNKATATGAWVSSTNNAFQRGKLDL